MSKISDLFKGFENYEYDHKQAFDYLFSKVIANESFLHGLREFVLTKLSDILNVPYDDLQAEFLEFSESYQANAVADFLANFGSADDSPES